MPRLASDSTWFTLDIEGAPELGVYAFTGTEEVSKPFEFSVEVVSEDDALNLTDLLGSEALLTIFDTSGKKRLVHGVVAVADQLRKGNLYTHYSVVLRPRFWFLGFNREHRIFQHKSVPDIIKQILNEQNFTGDSWELKLRGSYPEREYCTQYAESDKNFLSRICEEEGIYYYHEHKEDSHCLCFSDAEGGAPIEGENSLRYFQGSGQLADTAAIARLHLRERINSDTASYKDWNFETPKADLHVNKNEPSDEKAPVHSGIDYEVYQYPHLYSVKGEGERYVQIQLLRQLTMRKWVVGETDASRLNPGFIFTVKEHPRKDLNRSWWVTKVMHRGEQPQILRHEAPSDRGFFYNASFEAIPDDTRFVPELMHKKQLITGTQTAIITGPPGEEIYPDAHGRVKTQMLWDREGKWDEKTTCWIRVSQGWAGGEYGSMAVPRVGHEVLVSYLEGDPDRPIITGRVYHGLNTPPYELPAHKTRTVFKSLSSPGGGGFNELRIEDKKGEEEIYVHAEKDVNVYVKNDWKEHILNDQHRTVDNFSHSLIKGEDHQTVEKPRKVELKEDDHLIVQGDSHSEFKQKWLNKTGQEIHFKSGQKVVIEAGTDLTIVGGGSFIRLTPAGVIIEGPDVKINEGGSPGEGSGASPVAPKDPGEVDAGTVPAYNPITVDVKRQKFITQAAQKSAQPVAEIAEEGETGASEDANSDSSETAISSQVENAEISEEGGDVLSTSDTAETANRDISEIATDGPYWEQTPKAPAPIPDWHPLTPFEQQAVQQGLADRETLPQYYKVTSGASLNSGHGNGWEGTVRGNEELLVFVKNRNIFVTPVKVSAGESMQTATTQGMILVPGGQHIFKFTHYRALEWYVSVGADTDSYLLEYEIYTRGHYAR